MDLVFIFILGTIVGSFLNVVILRHGKKESFANGGSKCPKCSKNLKWYELVPILSWIFLLGKCSKCKTKISIQYPLVELGTGALFLMQYVFFFDTYEAWIPAFAGMTMGWVALSLLVVIFVYDLYHKIIPDVWSYSLGAIGLIYLFMNFSGWNLISPIVYYLPFWILWRISNGTWIGLGDGKLAFGMAGFLGLVGTLSSLVLAVWTGALVGILYVLVYNLKHKGSKKTLKAEIPFGPFMIAGFLIVYFSGIDVTGISGFLNVY